MSLTNGIRGQQFTFCTSPSCKIHVNETAVYFLALSALITKIKIHFYSTLSLQSACEVFHHHYERELVK